MGIRPTLKPLFVAQRNISITVYVVTWEVRDGYTGSAGYHYSFSEQKAHDLFMQMTSGPVAEVFAAHMFPLQVASAHADVIAVQIEECYEEWPELALLSS